MDDGEFAFRAAEKVIGVLCCQRHGERVRIGKPDVLAGEAHQSPQQVKRLLAGGQHAFEIVERGIGIGTTQRFVQRRNEAVMAFAILVIHRHPAMQQRCQTGGIKRFGEVDGIERFDLVEQEAAIAIRRSDECGTGIGGDWQRPVFAGLRAIEQLAERCFVQPPDDEHLGAAENGSVQLETGVFGGGAHQCYRAVLDDAKEAILLGAIEAVDFIDKQQRFLPRTCRIAGFGEQLFQFGNARKHRRNADEAQAHSLGEQPCNAGLAGAGRPPKDKARQASRRDHAANGAIGAGQVRLADDIGERLWSQSFGERRVGGQRGHRLSEQVSHWRAS